MLRLMAVVFAVGLSRLAMAESVPEFSLDYAKEHSTHIVVVDAAGKVLESWRGNLKPGAKLPYKADEKPLGVIEVPGILESKIKEVTGQRRVLFLIFVTPGRGFNLAPPHYKPAGFLKADIALATVWIEKEECFAIYQWMNPGPGAHLHPLNMDEKRLKKELAPGEIKANEGQKP